MRMGKLWMLAVGALAFAACGDAGGAAQVADGEVGGLDITVHNLNKEVDVKLVTLTIQGVSAGAVTQDPVYLDPLNSESNRDDQANPVTWTYEKKDLPVGDYWVQAFAYDRTDLTGNPDPIFSSVRVYLTVAAGQTKTAHIFMKQTVDEEDFNTPYITGVVFSAKPIFKETTTITVHGAEGAVGNLDLDAQGDGEFNSKLATGTTWERGTGNARTPGATISWVPADPDTAGSPEVQSITVRLTDQAGNDTSLKMRVPVDYERGDAKFIIAFNHAPEISVATSVVNDEVSDKSVVTMVATYKDDEFPAEDVTYTWNVMDCEDATFKVTDTGGVSPYSTPVGGGGPGIFSASVPGTGDPAARHTVSLTLDPAGRVPASPPSCHVSISVTDKGLKDPEDSNQWAPDSQSTRTQNIRLTVGTPDIDLGAGGAGGAGGTGGTGGSP